MKKAVSLCLFLSIAFIVIVIGNIVIAAQEKNQPPDSAIDAAVRTEVIEALIKDMNDNYVFPETAKKMETDLRTRLKNKEYDSLTSAVGFAKKLTEDLQAVSKDKHFRVRYSHQPIPVRKEEASRPTRKNKII